MYLNDGKRYADVVWISGREGILDGREELVIETLWYGYVIHIYQP